jgi:hypothetical protein
LHQNSKGRHENGTAARGRSSYTPIERTSISQHFRFPKRLRTDGNQDHRSSRIPCSRAPLPPHRPARPLLGAPRCRGTLTRMAHIPVTLHSAPLHHRARPLRRCRPSPQSPPIFHFGYPLASHLLPPGLLLRPTYIYHHVDALLRRHLHRRRAAVNGLTFFTSFVIPIPQTSRAAAEGNKKKRKDGVGAGGAGGGGGGGALGRDAPDRGQLALHDGVRGAPHGADPPARRTVPAQGAPHPHRATGARPRLAPLRPLHQARHPQGCFRFLPSTSSSSLPVNSVLVRVVSLTLCAPSSYIFLLRSKCWGEWFLSSSLQID